jgi:hypothetical protein
MLRGRLDFPATGKIVAATAWQFQLVVPSGDLLLSEHRPSRKRHSGVFGGGQSTFE